jgi:uncharacterized protein YdhG (YjbR/CyaY superfamily)
MPEESIELADPTTVDEYMATLSDDKRAAMEGMRQAIKAGIGTADAIETIAYKMPAVRSHGGQFLVSYDAYKNHYSLFPASDAVVQGLGDRLTPFLAGKGTIRFSAARPVPEDLVTEIVRIRVAENAAHRK